jgi:hypothetical protein
VPACVTRGNSENSVEKQYALIGPMTEVSVRCRLNPEVAVEFLVDVAQRPRDLGSRCHGERQADRVTRRGVGVLANDNHPYVVERGLECAQYVVSLGQRVLSWAVSLSE